VETESPGTAGSRGTAGELAVIETSRGPAHAEIRLPPGGGEPVFLLVATHGAGGTPGTPDVLAVRDAAAGLGAMTALVTQPYRVRGARAPGAAAGQDQAWIEVTAELARRARGIPLVQCGRSNGARVACRTARAAGAAGVIALAFPLHPPGHPGRSRAAELDAAGVPVLAISGDRDPFGVPAARARGGGLPAGQPAGTASEIRVVVLPGRAHSLDGDPAVIGEAVTSWLAALPGAGRRGGGRPPVASAG
jgi:predicted alpha/beta-hydrolase family hydrolase